MIALALAALLLFAAVAHLSSSRCPAPRIRRRDCRDFVRQLSTCDDIAAAAREKR